MGKRARIVGIIPARMGATRFPGKPLALIHGRAMIEHVYRRAAMCDLFSGLYLATCDKEIRDAATKFGAPVIMTASTHERCTDRVAEAAAALEADIVVNIQGDEPLLDPATLSQLCALMLGDAALPCCNLVTLILNEEDYRNSNQIKVVCNQAGYAMYMSREPIPSSKRGDLKVKVLRQLGLIAFRKDFLELFSRLPPTPLEQAESIDMLRALEHGYSIKVFESPKDSFGVDTPEDLRAAESKLELDPLTARYLNG